MSLHNRPEYNTPEIVAALKAHGMNTEQPDILADAFRQGWLAGQPGWEPQRCAECNCEFGAADCNWIKTPGQEQGMSKTLEQQGWLDMDLAPRTGQRVELRTKSGDAETGFWRDDTSWNMDGMYYAFDDDFTGWREPGKGEPS